MAISGVAVGEMVVGIDFRPQTGQLYAFGVNAAANTGTLYLVDPQTGAAAAVGTPGQIAFVDGAGNPVDLPAERATAWTSTRRSTVSAITTDTGLNFRINPNNGAAVDGDAVTAGINRTGRSTASPGSTGVSANAYTNSFGQPLPGVVTTLYTLDAASNSLFIQNPPNAGTQTAQVTVKLGGSPLDFTSVNGFDIPAGVTVATSNSAAAGFGFAGLTVGGVTSLYLINLVSGDAINLGAIGAASHGRPGSGGLASTDDFYLVDDPGDVVTESPNDGFDTVTTSINYALTANVENLVLQGDALTPLQGYGNGLANNLTGSAGANLLDGLGGVDTMAGGLGDDAYFVDEPNDEVIENGGEGNDTVFSSTVNYRLSETWKTWLCKALPTWAVGNSMNNVLYGNSGNNDLDGSTGADTSLAVPQRLVGGAGSDQYEVDNSTPRRCRVRERQRGHRVRLRECPLRADGERRAPGVDRRCDDPPARLRQCSG